jgi:hypothetical protein
VDTDNPESDRPRRDQQVLAWTIVAACVGIGIFTLLAWCSVSVERAAPNDALQHFDEVRSRLQGEPVLLVGPGGTITRRPAPTSHEPTQLSRLRVLAYRVREQQLVRADVPFWFIKVKGPAVRYTLRDTGLDLDQLGLTPADLERYGPCVVLDETRSNGDRLLVWTESVK